MPKAVRRAAGEEDSLFRRKKGEGKGARRPALGRLRYLEPGLMWGLLVLALLLHLFRFIAAGGAAQAVSFLHACAWALVLPVLLLFSLRFPLRDFAAGCLAVYGGRAVMDTAFALVGALRSSGQVGVWSLSFIGLTQLLLPLLLLLLPGICLQLVRLSFRQLAVQAVAAVLLMAAALFFNQLLQVWISAILYTSGGLGGVQVIPYIFRQIGGECLRGAGVFLLFLLLDALLQGWLPFPDRRD